MPWLLLILFLCWSFLGDDFLVCFCWVGVFFGFYFLYGYLESVVAVCCLFSCPVQWACSQGMSSVVRGWVTVKRWGKKVWNRRSLGSIRNGVREARETIVFFQTIELCMRLGRLDLRKSMRGVGLHSAYLLPREELPLVY